VSVDDFPFAGNVIASPLAEVALWCAPLAADDESFARIAAWLSAAENARAARFGREDLRRRYVIGRALLRSFLASRLALSPAEVPIARGPRGRPRREGIAGIDFNVSHTRDMSFIGMARGLRIGVDIERTDRDVNADGLARRVLAPEERAAMATFAADERRARFLRYWTCKEAMSKATGDALSAPFRHLNVNLDHRIELLDGPGPYEPLLWRLHRVALPSQYIATVALWSGAERLASL
jgi:4'-phosphopantetheinyl transferase